MTRLAEHFDPTSSGLSTYLKLESVLLQGDVASHEELMRGYPQLDIVYSAGDVPQTYDVSGAVEVMTAMSCDVRRLFPQVERLIRLLLICPISSCEAERSFSGLRRLKTWLHNSMTPSGLNAVAVCHVHQHYTG